MQRIITSTAAGYVWRVRRTPTDEKYTAVTYASVSELPIITAAHSAGKLSAPRSATSAAKTAAEALPDTGRVIMRGNISDGTPSISASGANAAASASANPDAEKSETVMFNSTSIGRRDTALSKPRRAPEAKIPVPSPPESRGNNMMTAAISTTAGTASPDTSSIIPICPYRVCDISGLLCGAARPGLRTVFARGSAMHRASTTAIVAHTAEHIHTAGTTRNG